MAMLNTLMHLIFVLCFSSLTTGDTSRTCNLHAKVKQVLLNDGFHRNLTYGIVLTSEDDNGQWLYNDCEVGIDQPLPAGVYANPNELDDLTRNHKLHTTMTYKVNVELPAEQSRPTSVYLIAKVTDGKAYSWLPVHARYHRAVPGGGMATNEIQPPKLYLHCPDNRLEICSRTRHQAVAMYCNGNGMVDCTWRVITQTMMTDPVIWAVPVGNTDHYYQVALGTGAVITVGALFLLKVLHVYQVSAKKNKQE